MRISLLIDACGSRPGLWPISRQLQPLHFQNDAGQMSPFQQSCQSAVEFAVSASVNVSMTVACNQASMQLAREQAMLHGFHDIKFISQPGETGLAGSLAHISQRECGKGGAPLLLAIPVGSQVDADQLLALFERNMEFVGMGGVVVATPDNDGRVVDTLADTIEASRGTYAASIVLGSVKTISDATRKLITPQDSSGQHETVSEEVVCAGPEIDHPLENLDLAILLGSVQPEKTRHVRIDVGVQPDDWNSVLASHPRDDLGNSVSGDVVTLDCRDTLIRSEKRLVTAVGTSNVAIIETADAILVADQNKTGLVATLSGMLDGQSRVERFSHSHETRPWGSFQSLHRGPGFQVKSLVVTPGARLSLQAHEFRSEHWTVVRGVATVTIDDETWNLYRDESVYIPLGARHRLANVQSEEMEIIEVQLGSYLGEDDIIRFEDDYDRPESF